MKTPDALLIPVLAIPAVLLVSSLRTLRELDAQRGVYLRALAGTVAARLESLAAAGQPPEAARDLVEEPAEIAVIAPGSPADFPALQPLWSGSQLYQAGFQNVGAHSIFRAYVPFHSRQGLRLARIDIPSAAADFLLVHARHNVLFSALAGVALLLLGGYAWWAARRAARWQREQLALEHLAHIGRMSAALAHEIRNPLGTIKGYAQLIRERAAAATEPLVAPILNETRRLESLVDNLLVYGRPPRPRPRPVAWSEIAGSLDVPASVEPALVLVTDPDLLRQVLLNLVRNAREAVEGRPGGQVRLEARRMRGALHIEVRDNGPGIPPAARGRLFEPFFTTKASGTGLGLAISRRLAHTLGGELELSPAPGGGTRALLRLPA